MNEAFRPTLDGEALEALIAYTPASPVPTSVEPAGNVKLKTLASGGMPLGSSVQVLPASDDVCTPPP
jgi:hypothetical protein